MAILTPRSEIITMYLGDRFVPPVHGNFCSWWYMKNLAIGHIIVDMIKSDAYINVWWRRDECTTIKDDLMMMEFLQEDFGFGDNPNCKVSFMLSDPDSIDKFREVWDKIVEVAGDVDE